jgi:hypothetical protein
MTNFRTTLLLAAAVTVVAAPAARAGTMTNPDTLKCYKVKDTAAKKSYTADLTGQLSDTGCVIKVPAKLLCNPVGATNFDPPANNAFGQNLAGNVYVCYKLKCAKTSTPVSIFDARFGNRTGTITSTKLLCAPGSTNAGA